MKIVNDVTLESIETISKKVVEMLRDEATQQGHKDTGTFDKSIGYKIDASTFTSVFYYAFYGEFLNNGVKKEKVNYSISVLIPWALRKGIIKSKSKKDLSPLYAIRKTHEKEGIPSKGSFKFSKNGRRIGFQDHVIKEIPKIVQPLIQNELIEPLKLIFFDILKNSTI